MVGFRELGMVIPKTRGESRLYISAFSRKSGMNPQNTGIPLIVEIKETKVLVHLIRSPLMGSNNMTTVIGQSFVKSSHKGNNGSRLINVMNDASIGTF